MRETFTGISKNEDYSLLGNNCVTTVQRTLEAVGFILIQLKRSLIE